VNESDAHAWVGGELLDLVAIFSPSEHEHDAVDHLERRCEAWDMPVKRMPVDGAADDLVIGWSSRPALLLTAHIDTVTPTWTWEATLRDGVVHGLGAGDCKGSVIAFALGMLLARERGVNLESLPVAFGVCVEEEFRGRGSIVMANALQPRFVIAGEPSRLDIGVAEAGFVDAICDVRGESAHGSFPERGDNAIEKAARLLLSLHDQPFAMVEHPLLGRNIPGTLWIEGGGGLHVIPGHARIRVEIRVVPGGPSAQDIERRLRELAAAYDADVELVEESVEPFETDPAGRLAAALSSAGECVRGHRPPMVGVPAWTDAHNFVELAGSHAVVWGPGDFGLAHDAGEAIDVDEVVTAARVVEELLAGADAWLTGEPS
jgi:acetylornithine deacetylase/succinyl-diaminopimelate desuccinylase-like protein